LPAAPPIYDLTLLLDLSATDDQRAKALADVRSQFEAGSAEILTDQSWGERALAYAIDHKEQAQYHLFQFHAAGPLVEALDRNLRIADGVIRHRIIKLAPGTPAAPDHGPRGGHHTPPAPPVDSAPPAPLVESAPVESEPVESAPVESAAVESEPVAATS
jgi:small subunit ribosomal protein S6